MRGNSLWIIDGTGLLNSKKKNAENFFLCYIWFDEGETYILLKSIIK